MTLKPPVSAPAGAGGFPITSETRETAGASAILEDMATNMDPLISPEDLQRSLTDTARFDTGMAQWALEVVSNTARLLANRTEWTADSVPPAVQAVVSLAARRLYTNPDRMTREASGDYSYGLDSSVTNADVFTSTEIGTLRSYSPTRRTGGLRTVSTTRGEATLAPHGRVPDGTDHGFPWYGPDVTREGVVWP